jgi:peptidoglycan hydrolase-like protein with peptidoglycan-binding domain
VPKRSRKSRNFEHGAGRLAAVISQSPREFVGILMATVATFAIFINALFLQHGPHPAPIFATRPLLTQPSPIVLPRPHPVAPKAAAETGPHGAAQVIADIQRALASRGFYEGSADGIWGAKTDAAARDFVQAAGSKIKPEAHDSLLRAINASNINAKSPAAASDARNDPIAHLLAPSARVLAVQRALTDFGYGQIKPTGIYDHDTKAAIEKFERDQQLPVTGEISDSVVRELSAMTGRPLE